MHTTSTSLLVGMALAVCVLGGTTPKFTYDPDTAVNCNLWYDNTGVYPCFGIPSIWGMTPEEFIAWNPSISYDTCEPFNLNQSYCVGVCSGSSACPTTTSSSSTTSSASSTSTAVPSPTQPGTASDCKAFHKVAGAETCASIAKAAGITVEQFLSWNIQVGGESCTNLWIDYYVCVAAGDVVGTTKTSLASSTTTAASKSSSSSTQVVGTTTTSTGNGVSTPTPTQPGMVSNCNGFHKVVSGDSCYDIANAAGITLAQFNEYNAEVGTNCTNLWLDYYVCTSIIGGSTTTTTTRASTTTAGNGVTTPTPYQSGMTTSCKTFHLVKSGETCADIATEAGVTTADIVKWNPAAGSDCTGLWANYYCCIAVL